MEHRCDCGQLFSSAALLSRHTTLAHTPPRIRKRRSPPPAVPPLPAPKPTAVKPSAAKPAVRKSSLANKAKTTDSRKSSVRSDISSSTNKTKKYDVKEMKNLAHRGEATDKTSSKSSTTPKSKSSAVAAHRSVPMPEKMKKIATKLK